MAPKEEERPQVYYIPGNYEDAGGVLGGKLQTRNAVELCVFCGPIAYLEYKFLHFVEQTNIIIACVTLIPLAALCIFGIGGESLSQILVAFIRYARKKRVLHYDSFTTPNKEDFTAFSIDKLLDNIAAGGFKSAIRKAREQAVLEREKREKYQPKASRKRKGIALISKIKAAEDEEKEGAAARRKQEQSIGPQTWGWVRSARREQQTTNYNKGKKKP